MRDWEKDLSPIARERLAKIAELSPQEKDKMRDSEKVNSILSGFYQGQIDPESLWKKLKDEGKPSLLREVQVRMVDSLGFGTSSTELQKRRDGVLAIESLKKERNTSMVEMNFRRMGDLQNKYRAEIEQAYNGIRVEVENNPRLRVKQVQQGQDAMVVQLTVDEAIKQLPQWRDFLANQEKRYSLEFARVIEKLRRELK
jgi:hypothetical protein